jgi:formylglycine-generating enzyme required for sulfatase activity
VIPTEDEWYKAAYYKSGSTNAGYWEYPTRSDTAPSNVLSATGTNNANFWNYLSPGQGVFTIGAPYYRTEVGAFANSPGPYGTFDQGGNLFQWTETRRFSSYRVERGGSFNGQVVNLRALMYDIASPASPPGVAAFQSDGFRVAYIPEPATLTLLIVGGTAVMRGRRCSGHP